jgi:hypothetical protein
MLLKAFLALPGKLRPHYTTRGRRHDVIIDRRSTGYLKTPFSLMVPMETLCVLKVSKDSLCKDLCPAAGPDHHRRGT